MSAQKTAARRRPHRWDFKSIQVNLLAGLTQAHIVASDDTSAPAFATIFSSCITDLSNHAISRSCEPDLSLSILAQGLP